MSTIANITVKELESNFSTKLIKVSGELDESNLPILEANVNPFSEDPGVQRLVFDFENLEFLSSKIIGYLADLYSSLAEAGRTIVIAAPNEAVMEILRLVGMDQFIKIYAGVNEALTDQ